MVSADEIKEFAMERLNPRSSGWTLTVNTRILMRCTEEEVLGPWSRDTGGCWPSTLA